VAFSATGFVLVLLMIEPPRHREQMHNRMAGTPFSLPAPSLADAAATWSSWPGAADRFTSLACIAPELAHFHLPAELKHAGRIHALHLGLAVRGARAAARFRQQAGSPHPRLAGSPLRLLPAGGIVLALSLGFFSLRGLPPAWAGSGVVHPRTRADRFCTGVLVPLISEEGKPACAERPAGDSIIGGQRLDQTRAAGCVAGQRRIVSGLGYTLGYLTMGLVVMALTAACGAVAQTQHASTRERPVLGAMQP